MTTNWPVNIIISDNDYSSRSHSVHPSSLMLTMAMTVVVVMTMLMLTMTTTTTTMVAALMMTMRPLIHPFQIHSWWSPSSWPVWTAASTPGYTWPSATSCDDERQESAAVVGSWPPLRGFIVLGPLGANQRGGKAPVREVASVRTVANWRSRRAFERRPGLVSNLWDLVVRLSPSEMPRLPWLLQLLRWLQAATTWKKMLKGNPSNPSRNNLWMNAGCLDLVKDVAMFASWHCILLVLFHDKLLLLLLLLWWSFWISLDKE